MFFCSFSINLQKEKKKQINLLFCLLFFCIIAAAQKSGPVNTRKDQQKSGDFVIRILPARGGTYGYDIYKNGVPVIRQSRNPFTLSPLRCCEAIYRKKILSKLTPGEIQLAKRTAVGFAIGYLKSNSTLTPEEYLGI